MTVHAEALRQDCEDYRLLLKTANEAYDDIRDEYHSVTERLREAIGTLEEEKERIEYKRDKEAFDRGRLWGLGRAIDLLEEMGLELEARP